MRKNLKFSNSYKGIAIALIALTSFSACKKSDTEVSANAFVRVVNSAEGSAAQDFYLDNTKVTSSAVAYTQSSSYLTTTNGSKMGSFKNSGTATANSSATVNIDGGKYYTVYYTQDASGSANFTTTDEQVASSANKAKVRFVHLSSAAANKVDLAVKGGAKIVSNLAYKTASTYQEVDAGTNFQLYAAGSTTGAIDIPTLTLQAGKIYTVYISGSTALTIKYNILVDKG